MPINHFEQEERDREDASGQNLVEWSILGVRFWIIVIAIVKIIQE